MMRCVRLFDVRRRRRDATILVSANAAVSASIADIALIITHHNIIMMIIIVHLK